MPKKRRSAAKRQTTQLESFAEDLGRLLGTAENKARGWLDQRLDHRSESHRATGLRHHTVILRW